METITPTYYTPELEELYGIDEIYFRHFGSMEHVKETINPLKLKDRLTAILTPEGKESDIFLVPERLKLKYLNKEDIESLGFIEDEEGSNVFSKDSNTILCFPNDYIVISKELGNVFIGTCKNKSKLKSILKDVGVL